MWDPRSPLIMPHKAMPPASISLSACAQEAVDNLLAQVSQLAAPGSRLCFDALHRDHMDGRVKMRGYTNGARVGHLLPLCCLRQRSAVACQAPMCKLYELTLQSLACP